MPFVIFEYLVNCACPESYYKTAELNVQGCLEAETCAEYLRGYGLREHQCPKEGDKNVLNVDGLLVCFGAVHSVRVILASEEDKKIHFKKVNGKASMKTRLI